MKFIKKNICKILIALSLSLTFIFTFTFTTKTYAIEQDQDGNINNNFESLTTNHTQMYLNDSSLVIEHDHVQYTLNYDLVSNEVNINTNHIDLNDITIINQIFNGTTITNGNLSINGKQVNLTTINRVYIENDIYKININYRFVGETISGGNWTFNLLSYNLYIDDLHVYYNNYVDEEYIFDSSLLYLPFLRYNYNSSIYNINNNSEHIQFEEFCSCSFNLDNFIITNNYEYCMFDDYEDTSSFNLENGLIGLYNYSFEYTFNIDFNKQNYINTPILEYSYYTKTENLYRMIFSSNKWYSQENYQSLYNDYLEKDEELYHLGQQYEELYNNYNKILAQYDGYLNYKNYGSLAYMKNIEIDSSQYDHRETINTIQELINTDYYAYQFFDISGYTHEKGVNYYNTIDIKYLENSVNANNIDTFIIVNETYASDMTCFISIYNITNQQTYNYNITPGVINDLNVGNYGFAINKDTIQTYLENNNITQYYIESLYLDNFRSGDNIDSYTNIYVRGLDKDAYTQGYNNGYLDGKGSQQQIIDNANKKIKELEDKTNKQENTINTIQPQLEQLQNNYGRLQANYDQLQDSYNRITSGDNDLYHMVIAIADTPIKIFKDIFNFDILGINISGIVTMILSLLIIIWLIKKII